MFHSGKTLQDISKNARRFSSNAVVDPSENDSVSSVSTHVLQHNDTSLTDYKRLKTVGQGSFGVAVLYRKLSDKSLVVMKLINMNDLTLAEKELAMNEVKVFSTLHHPNIITYYGSFVRNHVLHIEMEYADGGTLSQLVVERNANRDWMPEHLIWTSLEQIASAINYMHAEHILHRDLKTANVFLNKRSVVKIGDFGISKILNTRIHAQTVLGTPFYLSPEMCEGRDYDTKSDIWALGCILGEMCCLQKAFAATNLSELVTKIMSAQYNPIPAVYSDGIRSLLNLLLDVDSKRRPTAADILQTWIPLLHDQQHPAEIVAKTQPENAIDQSASAGTIETPSPVIRSVLYELKMSDRHVDAVVPILLPPDIQLEALAHSPTHFLAVSTNGTVYSWSDNEPNQFGYDYIEAWNHYPSRVESLSRLKIIKACAGDIFSIFLTADGVLLSCGDNRFGCLGLADVRQSHEPQRIDTLLGVAIADVAAGLRHIVARSADNRLFAWGTCDAGALGLGPRTRFSAVPRPVESLHLQLETIRTMVCSVNCTLVLLESGKVLACGQNWFDRLGLGASVEFAMILQPVLIDQTVLQVSTSEWLTAFVVQGGYVVTCGRNMEGQRGLGHSNAADGLTLVSSIQDRYICRVKCNKTYCVAYSDDNVISMLGSSEKRSSAQQTGVSNDDLSGPIDILALYSSDKQRENGHQLVLIDIHPLQHSILVHVDTTTPLE